MKELIKYLGSELRSEKNDSGGLNMYFDVKLELPEGESIKNGEFRIHLDTEDKYGKNSEVVHPVAITEDIVKNGVTVDLANYAEQLNKQDIASVRVDAVFNTDAHTAAHHENYTHPNNEYAYTVFGYVGIDRTK